VPEPEKRAIVVADTHGAIVHWNDGAQRLFGHASTDAIGQTLDLIVPEDFREAHWLGFHRAMSTGECKLDRAATHLPVRRADSTVGVFPARFVFVADAHGQAAGALAVYEPPDGATEPFSPIDPG
jgi:PAS domain S-box-containing protein